MTPSPLLSFDHFALLQDGGGASMLFPLAIMFAIFYFLLIRPQNKERKEQAEMRTNLSKGDKILTQGGIVAKVHSVRDQEVVLDLEGTAKLRVAKDAILRKIDSSTGSSKTKGKKEESDSAKSAEASA